MNHPDKSFVVRVIRGVTSFETGDWRRDLDLVAERVGEVGEREQGESQYQGCAKDKAPVVT